MFIAIGLFGLVLLAIGLVFDEAFEAMSLGSLWLSLPVIGVFLAAFGLGGWAVTDRIGAPSLVGMAAGAVMGTGMALAAGGAMKSASSMATDATPTPDDLLGRSGRVVTGILPESSGEILVELGGQYLKLGAVCSTDEEIVIGSTVVVVEVVSPTRVRVEPDSDFWSQ